jgi:hypothetical protein
MVAETYFTPATALLGGLLIGSAALILFQALGRVAGVSGIVGAVLRGDDSHSERYWRIAFLVGLMTAPLMVAQFVAAPVVRPSPASLPALIAAGLLVGLGTGLANGCTSGHGVCGVSRGARRSLVATATFMGFGFLTASLIQFVMAGGTP